MNIVRTAILLAFMTALFMGVGYLIGGSSGMVVALLVAGGLNFFLIGIWTKLFCVCMVRMKLISTRRQFIIRS